MRCRRRYFRARKLLVDLVGKRNSYSHRSLPVLRASLGHG